MNDFIIEYINYLRLEKNLSDNSIVSYSTDLNKFIKFLEEKNIDDFDNVDSQFISTFLAKKKKESVKTQLLVDICPP